MLDALEAGEIIEALIGIGESFGQIRKLDPEAGNPDLVQKEIAGVHVETQLQQTLGKSAASSSRLQHLPSRPALEDTRCLSMSLVTGIDRQPVFCRRGQGRRRIGSHTSL